MFCHTCCSKKNRYIGEFSIDLRAIWENPYHTIQRKWAILNSTNLLFNEKNMGYLQLDLSIVSSNEPTLQVLTPAEDCDVIENNLLKPLADDENFQRVLYSFSIFRGEFVDDADYFIQVSFGSIKSRTKIEHNKKVCEWNEKITFIGTFPSYSQMFVIDIIKHNCCQNRPITSIELPFSKLSKQIDGVYSLPAFGPAFIYCYQGQHNLGYAGRLLLSVSTEIFHNRTISPKKYHTVPIHAPLDTAYYWTEENFVIKVIILNALIMDAPKQTQLMIAMHCMANRTDPIELELGHQLVSNVRCVSFHHTPSLPQQRPIITLSFKCPDFRWKYHRIIALKRTLELGSDLLEKYKLFRIDVGMSQIGQLKEAISGLLGAIDESLQRARQDFGTLSNKKLIPWDYKWKAYVIQQVELLKTSIGHLKLSTENALKADDLISIQKGVDSLLKNLEELAREEQSTFPEGFLLMWSSLERKNINKLTKHRSAISSKTSPDAFYRFNIVEYLHIPSLPYADEDSPDLYRTKRYTILPRLSNCQHSCTSERCGCIYGKLDVAMWIGTEQEATEWEIRQNPQKIANREKDLQQQVQCHESTLAINCTVNVHQGKIKAGFDSSGLCDPKLVVLFENHGMATTVMTQTLSPLWNEAIEFHNVKLLNYNEWVPDDELTVMLLLLDEDERRKFSQRTNEIVGIGHVKCNLLKATTIEPPHQVSQPQTVHIVPSQRDQFLLNDDGRGGDKLTNEQRGEPVLRQWEQKSADNLWKKFDHRKDSILRWVGVFRNGQRMADVLMSIQITPNGDSEKATAELIQGIPASICPAMETFTIEVLFAGLRSMSNISSSNMGKFRVQLIFGELTLMSGLSCRHSGNSINFMDVYSTAKLMLPEKFEYWPPIVVQLIDCSRMRENRVMGASIFEKPETMFRADNVKLIEKYLIQTPWRQDHRSSLSMNTFHSAEEEPLIATGENISTTNRNFLFTISTIKGRIARNVKTAIEGIKSSPDRIATRRRGSQETEYTWWTKFYNSCSPQPSDYKHKLKIYSCELEQVPEFEQFHDWSAPFPLVKKITHNPMKQPKPYGMLKCKVTIRRSDDALNPLSNIPLLSIPAIMGETNLIVVVYVVQALNLRSRDIFSLSDAYVKLEYGKDKITDRPNYFKDRSNPVFGRRFVLHGQLPRDHLLKISVIDRDTCSLDDLIGTTTIDIEDRFRTQHFACYGLPQEYNLSGYNAWRYPQKPSVLLHEICTENGIIEPTYVRNTIHMTGITLRDDTVISNTEDLRERLALTVLKNFHQIPVLGRHFIPEHVESRPLFHPDYPGIEQGRLQLWIEIYPSHLTPNFVDITPNPPKPFELRVIVWNTQDVILDEKNIFGKKMSDIYIKCWLQDVEDAQFTDIHYRSLDGTGNFNWRMIFPFHYSSSETMMIIAHKKSFYEQLETEQKVPPLLTVQVWDNDLFSRDDFLGTLNLNLTRFPQPASRASKCVLPAVSEQRYINLFREDSIRGWFPIVGKMDSDIVQTGKIELELQVLTEEEALLRPAGKGRKYPQALAMPDRPDTSFNWYRNPLKSMKMILWPHARKACLVCFIITLIAVLCYGLIKNIPATATTALARKASLDRTVRTGVVAD
ncbi:otoferlin-like [Toxorhynchites rutilus septentrionalis]|uniref:otoferlin-like n=1 Tax=Toxorhynchites rutilus septentrionalis TaxID=329112 RepID=UPI0024787BC5|nr:otoferlin-like [Toxorhynchites rutilus septentrionalis]